MPPLKIHDHWQKAEYADPSEWPAISFQGQFFPGSSILAPDSLNPFQAHTHIESAHWPYGAELGKGDIVEVPIKIVLFHTEGRVTQIWPGQFLPARIIWDATGTETPPDMIGDPMSEVSWTGRAFYDPEAKGEGVDPQPVHGWANLGLWVRVQYFNGQKANVAASVPYFSMLDPTAPETPYPHDGFDEMRAIINPVTHDPGGASVFGSTISNLRGHQVPILAPFNSPVPMDIFEYNYGVHNLLPFGTYEVRLDPDAHHGHAGLLLRTQGPVPGVNDVDPLTPMELGAIGKHKLAFDWITSGKSDDPAVRAAFTQDPPNQSWSRMVITVETTTGPAPQPPPTNGLTTVPNITGLPEALALTRLADASLRPGSRTDVNSQAEIGTVFGQDPPAGTVVQQLRQVNYKVSLGPGTTPPPDDWHTAPEPMEPQQLGTGPRRRIKIGDKTVELT